LNRMLRCAGSRNVKHHSSLIRILTPICHPDGRQCLPVSLAGAASSQIVTEEREAWLSTVGNRATRVWLEARLTVRPTSRADAKAGPNDPMV
jgi:hypothetical protein